jgi:hypothetical protein
MLATGTSGVSDSTATDGVQQSPTQWHSVGVSVASCPE